jgi:hypothetical protein
MDIFDFIKSYTEGNGGNGAFINREMVSINIPRDDMKELIVVIAVNSAMIEGILRDYRGKMTRIDVLGLESALNFGKSVVTMLSVVTGITQKELTDELKHFMESARSETAQKMKVHFNKSKENIDSFTLRVFGDKDT